MIINLFRWFNETYGLIFNFFQIIIILIKYLFQMEKSTIAILILLGISTLVMFNIKPQDSQLTAFESFKTSYGKSYINEVEEQYRKTIFLKNLIKIEEHNSNKANTYTIGVTQFADLTQE